MHTPPFFRTLFPDLSCAIVQPRRYDIRACLFSFIFPSPCCLILSLVLPPLFSCLHSRLALPSSAARLASRGFIVPESSPAEARSYLHRLYYRLLLLVCCMPGTLFFSKAPVCFCCCSSRLFIALSFCITSPHGFFLAAVPALVLGFFYCMCMSHCSYRLSLHRAMPPTFVLLPLVCLRPPPSLREPLLFHICTVLNGTRSEMSFPGLR